MIKFLKKLFKFLMGRLFLVSIFLLIQIVSLGYALWRIDKSGLALLFLFDIISVLVSFKIVNRQVNPAYKISWILFVLLVPLAGSLFYILFGRNKFSRKNTEYYASVLNKKYESLSMNEDIGFNDNFLRLSSYIKNTSKMDAYNNTKTILLTPGEVQLESLLEELQKAKKFIFMEYFIVREGTMWNRIREVLVSKVKEGVDVRFMYDDFGSINKVPPKFKKNLIKDEIKVVNFNPYTPRFTLFMNYRDHRKITIIDGNIAFTGGVNIGDEYINLENKFGHWKDTSILIKGKAVWNLTLLFLQNWTFSTKEEIDLNLYKPTEYEETDGIVHIFGDTPIDNHLITENTYISIINNAKKYVYITTPYLIIDNEIITALKNAALSGVDVRIIVPHIPDKKIIFYVTQSYYQDLIPYGVKIFEYLPGFLHSKSIVSDDEIGMVGTANLDYRSLYLLFENSCLLYKTNSVKELADDLNNIISLSQEITLEDTKKQSIIKKTIAFFLRAFSPLM